jgi:acetyltransferase-like isoleucine patch superfamily enzyme
MNTFLLYIFGGFIHCLPPTRFFSLKRLLYKFAGVKIGKNVRIASSAKILGSGDLTIGDNTWIGHEVIIFCSDKIFIGKDCDIAPRVYMGNGTHSVESQGTKAAGKGISLPITIGDGCWICANCTILPLTKIGECSIVAAGSVVKGKIPSRELWGGIIAKKIRKL